MPASNPRKEFLIGFVGYWVLNLALFLIFLLVGLGAGALPRASRLADAANTATMLLCFCAPGIVNLGALIYFFIKRRWIALGGLAGFASSLVCGAIGAALFIWVIGGTLV